jgi:hypothetical protein
MFVPFIVLMTYRILKLSDKEQKRILKQQSNKCAKKPHSHIDKLQGYTCTLWSSKRKGKFKDDEYVFAEVTMNYRIKYKMNVALCKKCASILKMKTLSSNNRNEIKKTGEVFDEYDEGSENAFDEYSTDSDNESKNIYNIVECHDEYRVIYYSRSPGIINIYDAPSLLSDKIGEVYYGDILQTCGIIFDLSDTNKSWIKIKYGNIVGFVKMWMNRDVVVEKINSRDIIKSEQRVINESIMELNKISNDAPGNDCCVCFMEMTEKIALIPCGHTHTCQTCIKQIKKCPVCNKKIISSIKIYL